MKRMIVIAAASAAVLAGCTSASTYSAAQTPASPRTSATAVPAPSSTRAKPQYTTSQQQAIGSAQDYLATQAFSRKGLIQQLSSKYGEGFSRADATFAVSHIQVNWNKEAVQAAREYLSTQHFSRAGLIEQLSSPYGENFTEAQAVYAVNHVGL